MQKQTRFTVHAWLRAVGYVGLIVSLLVLLYQVLMYLDLHTWQSIGIADLIRCLGWDEIYWLPSADSWPIMNKLMTLFLHIPLWLFGIVLWGVLRLYIGSPKKDETI